MLASLIASAVLIAWGGGADAGPERVTQAPGVARAAAAPPLPASAAPAAAGPGAPTPVVFNAPNSARPGDIVSLQGEDFGSAPVVWLEALGRTQATPLPVLNQVGSGLIAVQIPPGAGGALALRVSNGANTSARVLLNAALPQHLDATHIVPGGAFRVFGRNLWLPGSKPVVTVDGLAAGIDLARSDEHMLAVTAPAGLAASSAARIAVDNGNGSGAGTLERRTAIVTGASGDPLGLGVGWGAGFAQLMKLQIAAASDARLRQRVRCDGRSDDSAALQGALALAQRLGGGVVTLPAGTCVLGKGVQLLSRTVLQGAGKDLTELQHSVHSPLHAFEADLLALRHLTLTNTGAGAGASLNLKHSRRVAVQGVRVNQGDKAMAWLYGHTDLAVLDSEFLQTGSIGAPGAAHLSDNAGLVFSGNRLDFRNNIGGNFDRTRDAYVQGNRWTRDASRQGDPGVVHVVTLNFARRLALVGNSFRVLGGPVDPAKNDGETLLSEGGGARHTEGLGQAAGATATSLLDPLAQPNPNALVQGALPDNYGITIVAGKGVGQSRRVVRAGAGSFEVDRPWAVLPDASSRYATAVWGLEQVLIKDNTLSDNPRGIVLWSTALRDVEIVGNTLQDNAGILVRAFQRVSAGFFTPILNVRVVGNRIASGARRFPSYLSIHFANGDGQAFGTSHMGVEVRRNVLVANSPNLPLAAHRSPAEREGYMNQMNIETANALPSDLPRLLGTVMQDNRCVHCATAFRLGLGAVGTVLSGNQLEDSGALWQNAVTGLAGEGALATWVR